jgi:hypothetical protein
MALIVKTGHLFAKIIWAQAVNGMIPMGLPSFNNAKAMITTSKKKELVNDYKKRRK